MGPALAGTFLLAAVASSLAAAAADPEVGDEIVVTARRIDERMDEVPLMVRALSATELERSGVDGLYSLAARAPGLSFESVWGGGLSLPTMRGQFSPSLGDTVGVFVDGVYQANRNARDIELLDLERVEVVHGPQSALYGHSTFAGAIGYVSRRPTPALAGGAAVDVGSDGYRTVEAWASGPLGGRWRGRLAASDRSFDGTATNLAAANEDLGALHRSALALALAIEPGDSPVSGSLAVRYQKGRDSQPAVAAVEGADFNCGARDRASGLWSYWCGPLPESPSFNLSPDLPDSQSQVGQVLLELSFDLGTVKLESDTSWYDASSNIVRDFDASFEGVQYGVCSLGVNCAGPAGIPRLVNRLVYANQVTHDLQDTRQLSQELRLRGAAGRVDWLVGGVVFDTGDQVRATFGTASGDLMTNEQLTAVLPATPQLVGPLSLANRSLVADPNAAQVDRLRVENRQRSFAVFGTLDHHASDRVRLRAELRATRERTELDSQVVNFQPSFGTAIAPHWFNDVTGRLSVEYRMSANTRGYVSAAKGSRPGGINATPNLPPAEQVYQPEYNWTSELGLRHRGDGLLRALDLTAYYIDWRDTQINGLPSQPGLTNLIVLNTVGLSTRGVELTAELAPADWLRAQLAWSLADPRFRAGSDDYGSGAFCGLSAQNATSSFCIVGPPRDANPNLPGVVPWLDGNAPGRAPRVTWHAALIADPPWKVADWRGWARVDVNHQDDVYERQINGAKFGQRTLVDARIGVTHDNWSVELWGMNLADTSYVRASFARFPIFYPTMPRPIDNIYADGRRLGLTVRWTYR
jgi:iron complex outermembrane recepter protein